jgi:hypothetical protein
MVAPATVVTEWNGITGLGGPEILAARTGINLLVSTGDQAHDLSFFNIVAADHDNRSLEVGAQAALHQRYTWVRARTSSVRPTLSDWSLRNTPK